ncbi:hypothetical protein MLD38_011315 [Melastoma candidum]|uniref:Uncharacterized protein n=1 Tax=Melastoma candidum TaxID=119954 RepID=A0ACB9R3Z8_9MYRT|nr:hypothetical protein MLD38_011315 [Melastoma candidum]
MLAKRLVQSCRGVAIVEDPSVCSRFAEGSSPCRSWPRRVAVGSSGDLLACWGGVTAGGDARGSKEEDLSLDSKPPGEVSLLLLVERWGRRRPGSWIRADAYPAANFGDSGGLRQEVVSGPKSHSSSPGRPTGMLHGAVVENVVVEGWLGVFAAVVAWDPEEVAICHSGRCQRTTQARVSGKAESPLLGWPCWSLDVLENAGGRVAVGSRLGWRRRMLSLECRETPWIMMVRWSGREEPDEASCAAPRVCAAIVLQLRRKGLGRLGILLEDVGVAAARLENHRLQGIQTLVRDESLGTDGSWDRSSRAKTEEASLF